MSYASFDGLWSLFNNFLAIAAVIYFYYVNTSTCLYLVFALRREVQKTTYIMVMMNGLVMRYVVRNVMRDVMGHVVVQQWDVVVDGLVVVDRHRVVRTVMLLEVLEQKTNS